MRERANALHCWRMKKLQFTLSPLEHRAVLIAGAMKTQSPAQFAKAATLAAAGKPAKKGKKTT